MFSFRIDLLNNSPAIILTLLHPPLKKRGLAGPLNCRV
jgi:hypothetical protein